MKIKRVEHVAIAVNSLKEMMALFEGKLGLRLEYTEDFPQYDTKIAMYPVGETYLELLEGTSAKSTTAQWVTEKGQSLYHICLEVEDIDGALDELRAKGVKLLDDKARIGHGGSRIAFLDPASTGDILIELAELPAGH